VPKLRLAPAARDDVRDIRIYSKAIFGPGVATSYISGLRATLATLTERTSAGAVENDLGDDIRGFAYRSHRIYYRAFEDGVLIIRILHHSRNALRAMKVEQ
jgi:toxin ParE1/3/4